MPNVVADFIDVTTKFLAIPKQAAPQVFTVILMCTGIAFFIGWGLATLVADVNSVTKPAGQTGSLIMKGTNYWEEDNVKMVLLVRADLKMTPGKVAAQVGHAAVGLFKRLSFTQMGALEKWEACGQPKVALRVEDWAEMKLMRDEARRRGLPTFVVEDAGRTQVQPNSRTVVAILGPNSVVDDVTGSLKLY